MDVAVDEARRLVYPALDLSRAGGAAPGAGRRERPALRPEGGARRQVLVLHGEIEGVLPDDQRHASSTAAR